jgi:hypothetical protein
VVLEVDLLYMVVVRQAEINLVAINLDDHEENP